MKKVLFAVLITVAVSVELLAGSPTWNTGYVILADGRKVEGKLSYNWKVEVVQVRLNNGLVKAYSAGNADSFAFYDANQQILRRFSSVELPKPEQFSHPVFLEELATGPLTVYRRLRHAREFIKITRPSIYSDDTELMKDIDNFNYMVVNRDGQFFDLAMFTADLWPMMATYQEQLSDYIKSRDVDTSTTLARLLLINQYNYLSADKSASLKTSRAD
ncbi:hypothetical protein [Fibrella forsythiae]|uniref:DUF4369 domain-containing protein n=1 Tax=Fibrella forsythiae TaxID=2817061 RepID=A0ABS3JNE1_9BACT|nr:hypothetical protein [Fibrella forsythiae]MBO0951530.1 hypothetical protein [Fibrella forsythiae]